MFVALSINLRRIMEHSRLVTGLAIRGQRSPADRRKWQLGLRTVLAEAATLPAVAGAAVLTSGSAAYGLLALGAVLCIGVGILDAWVLLVEILR